MIFLALTIWLSMGQVEIKKDYFKSLDECLSKGGAFAEKLSQDPRVDGILYGACIPVKAETVSNSSK